MVEKENGVVTPPVEPLGYPPERRAAVLALPKSARMARLYTNSAVVLCVVTLVAEAAIIVTQPNNIAAIVAISSITGPTIAALVAAGVRGVSIATDGQTQQLLESHGEVQRLRGLIEGLKANPVTNLQ